MPENSISDYFQMRDCAICEKKWHKTALAIRETPLATQGCAYYDIQYLRIISCYVIKMITAREIDRGTSAPTIPSRPTGNLEELVRSGELALT
jgi:hypothetical protein